MTAKKVNRYLLLLFAIGLGFSIYIVRYASNWLSTSSQDLIVLKTEVEQLQKKQSDLEKAKKVLAEKATDIQTLSKVLPSDKDQARVVQEIYAIASQANVTIDSVGFPSSTLGAQTVPKVVATPTTDATTTGATPSSSEPAPKPVATVSQATPVKEIPGVQSIELSIGTIKSKDASIKGVRYEEMMNLIRLIERNRRTMQIRTIGIGQSEAVGGAPTYSLTLSIVIFIQP